MVRRKKNKKLFDLVGPEGGIRVFQDTSWFMGPLGSFSPVGVTELSGNNDKTSQQYPVSCVLRVPSVRNKNAGILINEQL